MTDEPIPTKRARSEAPVPRAARPFDVDNCYLTTLEVKDADGKQVVLDSGIGLAFCHATGQLALSDCFYLHGRSAGSVSAFLLDREKGTGTPSFVEQWKLPRPTHLDLDDEYMFGFGSGLGLSGALAFTEDGPPLLLAADHGRHAVHVIDPVHGSSLGHLVPEGTIVAPRGVSTQGSMVAVSFWRNRTPGNSGVALFQRTGDLAWTALWSVTYSPVKDWYEFRCPNNIRIAKDGEHIAVSFSDGNDSVLLLDAKNGDAVGYLAAELGNVWDMEECQDGWLVSCVSNFTSEYTVYFVGTRDTGKDGVGLRQTRLPTKPRSDFAHVQAVALVLVPGLGLVARTTRPRRPLALFTTPDLAAMGAMSGLRVAWITVVVRGVFRRARK